MGVRKRGAHIGVTPNDQYHIGSCGKSMTATLAGILADRHLLSWDTSPQALFPEITFHPSYGGLTLKHLLTHMGGLPPYTDPREDEYETDEQAWRVARPPAEVRREVVLPTVLARAAHAAPGEKYDYSNMGYTLAGAMLEQVAGTPFEELLREELFRPLGLTTAGFGAPGTPGMLDQPVGHDPKPIEPGPEADNLPAFSPPGTAHMSILDFARTPPSTSQRRRSYYVAIPSTCYTPRLTTSTLWVGKLQNANGQRDLC